MIRGGKSLVTSLPAFSNDAKKLLVCTGNTVSIFSTSTALLIHELEGHAALVTSVIVVPVSASASKILCYCWTTSLDGTIRYWDFSVPEQMKMINIKSPIHSMVIPGLLGQSAESNEKPPDMFGYISTVDTKEPEKQQFGLRGQIRKCNLTKSRLVGGVTLAEIRKPEFITISPLGKYFAVHDKRKLCIWVVPTKDSDRAVHKKIRLHHSKNLTSLAFHPTERILAAGDITGRILIWRGFGIRTFSADDKLLDGGFSEDERPGVRGDDDADSCTTWHWHSAEVKVLFFSSDGAYLYSGGKEGVFVVWQLDTGKQKFLPRIGSPILYFINSSDPSLSSISCADNQIHLLKMPSMEILKSISGIKLPSSILEIYKDSCSGFAFNPTAGVVAICSENYRIQLYSLFDDREISEVQVCERNHQPTDEVMVIVNLVAVSLDGSVMITVETRLPEEGIGSLVSLKFWACGSQNKDYNLSTVIYEPHRDAGISGVAFNPNRHMAATASYGGDFKIWVCSHQIQEDQMLQNTGWTCHAVGSYKRKPMTAATFSADGSVLAVAAEKVITLWDPERNVLVTVIGETLEPIISLSFVGKSEYVVSASQGSNPQLTIWSLSKLSESWSYKLYAEAVACTVDDSFFAVLTLIPKSARSTESSELSLQGIDGVILLFNVGDPVPMATWFVRKAKGGGLAFIDINSRSSEEKMPDGEKVQIVLAYVNGDHEYILFDPCSEQVFDGSITRKKSSLGLDESERFGYASIYGDLPEFNLKRKHTPEVPLVTSERPWETLFSGSSHNLPLTKLCSVFLESLLVKRITE